MAPRRLRSLALLGGLLGVAPLGVAPPSLFARPMSPAPVVAPLPRCALVPTAQAALQARQLLHTLQRQLKPVEQQILATAFLREIEAGRLPLDRIAAVAAEEFVLIPTEQRSFLLMARRWRDPVGAEDPFFLALARNGDGELQRLLAFASALGLSRSSLDGYEPRAASQIYPAQLAQLAVSGDRAEVAAALLINYPSFASVMARVNTALLERYRFLPEQIRFVSSNGQPLDSAFQQAALAQVSLGLQQGACPDRIRRAARLLQAAELDFWQAASEPPGSPLPVLRR